jgi:hypothetical protein
MKLPNDITDIETPEILRPRIARKLGLPLHWDVAIDDLPRPNLLSAAGWAALIDKKSNVISKNILLE